MNSMTGFGRSEFTILHLSFNVEVKSVNHRYFDLAIKLPRKLSFMEDRIRQLIKPCVGRGRLDVFVNQQTTESSNRKVVVDSELCKSYRDSFQKVSQELNISNDLSISLLAQLPEVICIEQQDVDEDLLWHEVEQGMRTAVAQLLAMRTAEGEALQKDLEDRTIRLRKMMAEVRGLSSDVSIAYQERLLKRIHELLGQDAQIDESRMMMEVAILAEKSSIDEEIVRFNSHMDQFANTMNQNEPVGRKLDFIVQELNREINTIGSKAGDQKVGSLVVEVKSELEKIREQVQNIE